MSKQSESLQRPTQKTIAQMTGLAIATVSRALADAPDINEQTKQRVRRVAAQIGYQPDRAGVRLRTGRTNVISLVLPSEHDIMNHTARLISSVASTLRDSPFHLIITPFFPSEDPMSPIKYIVETRSADAIIINQTTPKDPRVRYMLDRDFPFATHGRTDWCQQHPFFDFDNTAFAQNALAEIAARGRKSVLLVFPPQDQFYARNLIDGSAETAQERGLELHIANNATSDDPMQKIHGAVEDRLQRRPEIDAILCSSSNAAIAAISAAESVGRVVGEDIDVAAKEAVPFLRNFRSEILAWQEDVARAGHFLAQACIKRIAEPSAQFMQEIDGPSPRKPS